MDIQDNFWQFENDSALNSTFWNYDYYQTEMESLAKATTLLRNIFIPCIVILGLTGNTLSVIVFSIPAMNSSSSLYLRALAVVDNVFLINLLLTWIDGQFWNILKFKFACEAITYVTYVTSFLSVWFIIGFTTDRFIAICFPLKSLVLISISRTKKIIWGLTVTSCLLYGFSFWATDTVIYGGLYKCVHKEEAVSYLQVITWIDTVITMVLPFLLIAFMNIKVSLAALRCHRKQQQTEKLNQCPVLLSRSDSDSALAHLGTQVTSVAVPPLTALTETNIVKKRYSRYKLQLRVTKLLLVVSTTFLVLNLPSHIVRLYNLIVIVEYLDVSMVQYFLQEIALLLYYCTFGCNFILYAMTGKKFKKALKGILKCSSSTKESCDIRLSRNIRNNRQMKSTISSL